MNIRNVDLSDFERILELNDSEVMQTSPMTLARLNDLHQIASYHRVAEHQSHIAGFLLAIDSSKEYHNANFNWFSQRFSRFIYIDRIVIDRESKGQGIGRALYLDLFDHAKKHSIPIAVCEYNLQPLNQASQLFHSKLGFKSVGEQSDKNSPKIVSMQVLAF